MKQYEQNMNQIYKPRCLDYVEIDGYIWFANIYLNALMKLDMQTGNLEIIEKFPHYAISHMWLYSSVYHIGQCLVFVPDTSMEIVSYHMEERKFISIPLEEKYIRKNKTQYISSYRKGRYIYMFPTEAKCVVKYDAITHTVTYLENAISELMHDMPENFKCFLQKYEVVGNSIYFPVLELNAVAVFDVEKESAEIHYLNIEGGCSTIDYKDGYFYLASWDSANIFRWEPVSGEIIAYKNFPQGFDGEYMFINSYREKDRIIFFPHTSNMIISLMIDTGEIRKLRQMDNADNELLMIYFVKRNGGNICFSGSDFGFLSSFHCLGDCVTFQDICNWNDDYNRKVIDEYLAQNGFFDLCSEDVISLSEYFDLLLRIENFPRKAKESGVGEKINGYQ